MLTTVFKFNFQIQQFPSSETYHIIRTFFIEHSIWKNFITSEDILLLILLYVFRQSYLQSFTEKVKKWPPALLFDGHLTHIYINVNTFGNKH